MFILLVYSGIILHKVSLVFSKVMIIHHTEILSVFSVGFLVSASYLFNPNNIIILSIGG
jgi:hypothetical protein